MTALWHPFSDMAAVRDHEFVVDRAEGVWVHDEAGRRYLDGCASLWYANVGHGRQEIVDAAMRQMSRLESYSCFADVANRPALDLAERLAALAPVPDAKVFLGSGGADAIDTAVKLARGYWQARGESQRVHVVSRETGYHGTHGYGTSIVGIAPNREGWGVLAGENTVAPLHDLDGVEKVFAEVGAENIAAFVMEPVTGAGGVHLPRPGYVEGVADLCRRHGVLLVIDAVICGFGRLGTWFGIERFPDVRPDMITFAKGVTSGYLPLGGVITSGEVAAPWWTTPGERTLRHGPTYSGHPTCCAAAMATLDIYEREGLIPRGQELEETLAAAVRPLADHPLVHEVRAGFGLLAGVELTPETLARVPDAPNALLRGCRAAGLLVRGLGRGVAVSPPLTITSEEIGVLADALHAGLDALPAEDPLPSAPGA